MDPLANVTVPVGPDIPIDALVAVKVTVAPNARRLADDAASVTIVAFASRLPRGAEVEALYTMVRPDSSP